MTTHERSPALPADGKHQVYVSVKALSMGLMYLPHVWVFQDAKDVNTPTSLRVEAPTFAFLIEHPTKGKIMFDLGMNKPDGEGTPPAMQPMIREAYTKCDRDVVDILQSGGIQPADIKTIIFSHLHWDHVGDPSRFTSADFVLGSESATLLADTYPSNPNSTIMELPADRPVIYVAFDRSQPATRWTRVPFGPFSRAVDFFGDGSIYLVDAPGHAPGHLIAAPRVGPNTFLILAGDACHVQESYRPGTRVVSSVMHAFPDIARETVGSLKTLDQEYGNAIVVLAHEKEKANEMPLFPERVNEWALEEARKRATEISAPHAT